MPWIFEDPAILLYGTELPAGPFMVCAKTTPYTLGKRISNTLTGSSIYIAIPLSG